MKRTLGFFALLALVIVLAAPAQAQQSASAPDRSFSLTIPSGWVAIPTLELYLFEHPGRTTPVTPEELAEFRNTRMGFQRPADAWFTLPYMIVRLETGKKRGPQELFMDHVLAEKDSEAGAPGEGYRFREKDHLPTKRMHYYKDVSYSAAQGRKVAMGVYTYLTSRGFLRVAWFVGENELRAYEPTLHQSAMSVKLSPELEYVPEGKK
ncbi:hypothetical protein [Fundidesulfovibrio putealis]|uniref:hypothetical protein n=1 Tax=Fundidesulfovibrio putealis TaxID=270496 RepID=UPI000421051B|nr:hypothetical protein [Fundidesulfovibrio putealis]